MSTSERGQSVIEVIVAVAILVIIAASAVVTILGSFATTRLAKEETQAAFFAMEGIEAVQSIRNQDWNNLSSGTYGLSSSGGVWVFSGSSDDPEGSGKFSRVITLAEVQRGGYGNIVDSGGTVDEDSQKVTSTITWDFTPGRANTVDMAAYLTNWQTGKGEGVISGECSQQADCLTVDTSGAYFGGGGKLLQGITLGNIDTISPVTLDKMTISWTGGTSGSTMKKITIDGSTVWTGSVGSGIEVDITDVDLAVESVNIPLDSIEFSKDMSGATFSIIFIMSDSSSKTVSGITP